MPGFSSCPHHQQVLRRSSRWLCWVLPGWFVRGGLFLIDGGCLRCRLRNGFLPGRFCGRIVWSSWSEYSQVRLQHTGWVYSSEGCFSGIYLLPGPGIFRLRQSGPVSEVAQGLLRVQYLLFPEGCVNFSPAIVTGVAVTRIRFCISW